MVKIITDSSTMYTIDQGKELGFDVIPLSVAINKKTYVAQLVDNGRKISHFQWDYEIIRDERCKFFSDGRMFFSDFS